MKNCEKLGEDGKKITPGYMGVPVVTTEVLRPVAEKKSHPFSGKEAKDPLGALEHHVELLRENDRQSR